MMYKSSSLIIACLLLISNSFAQVCVSGDCENGYGTYVFTSGSSYTGDFVDGQMHGWGRCTYTNGNIYEGEWKLHMPNGSGILITKNGDISAGVFKSGQLDTRFTNVNGEYVSRGQGCVEGNCRSGSGVYIFNQYSWYVGSFKDNVQTGLGTMYFENGDRYVGEWREGRLNGEGTYYVKDGRILEGRWVDNTLEGKEIEAKEEVAQKVGCIKGDCINGTGVYLYEDGGQYEGQFRDGLYNGSGSFVWSDGSSYSGGFSNGQYHGSGRYLANGKETIGTWKDGHYQKQADKTPEPIITIAKANTVNIYAVVIGVSDYTAMPKLSYTDDDAFYFYSHLLSNKGGALPEEQVNILVNEKARKEDILLTISETFARADEDDVIMLYFSGHGLRGYFLPQDYNGDLSSAVSHQDISRLMNMSKAKHKICIADACHSGSFTRGLTARGEDDGFTNTRIFYDAFLKAQGGVALLMSSLEDQVSLESNRLGRGVFSKFLIDGLSGAANTNGDKIVTITELFEYVNTRTMKYTAKLQKPILHGDFDPNMPVGLITNQ